MSIWTRLGRLFTVDDTILDEDFTLTPDDEQSDVAQSKPQNDDKQASEAGQNADANVNDQEGEQEQTDEEQRPEQDAGPASGPKRRNTRYLKPTKIGVRAQQEAEKQQDTDPQEKGQSEKEHQETDSNEKQSTGKRSQEQYS
ncbi:MAG: hypothetical protein ACXVC1_09815, partial [Tumebacillaceae bacterium]